MKRRWNQGTLHLIYVGSPKATPTLSQGMPRIIIGLSMPAMMALIFSFWPSIIVWILVNLVIHLFFDIVPLSLWIAIGEFKGFLFNLYFYQQFVYQVNAYS